MPTGNTITDSLRDSMPTYVSSARAVREYTGVVPRVVERVRLGTGTGLDWKEVAMEQLTAQAIDQNTILDNPQQLVDTPFTVTPTLSGVMTLIIDEVAMRISQNAFARTGGLAMNSIVRKMDEDGIATIAAATTTLAGAGTTLTSGHLSAASYRITSNPTEPSTARKVAVLHGFQIKDLSDELTAGVGTYEISTGLTQRTLMNSFQGQIANVRVFEDGNITIDGNVDAGGAVFSSDAVVLVESRTIKTEVLRKPDVGGGATAIYIYSGYAYGIRNQNWIYAILSDATVPTS